MDPTAIDFQNEEKPFSMISKFAAEFVGTLLFVFIGSISALNTTPVNSTTHSAFAHGIAIMILATAFGHISGGHFNPAVTLSIYLSGKFQILPLILYICAQLSGAVIGSLIVKIVTTQTEYEEINGGTTTLSNPRLWLRGIIIEAILTTLLTTVVLIAAVDGKSTCIPVVIGFTVIMDVFALKSVTGASMNPARSFGPSAVATIFLDNKAAIWETQFVYWIGPFLGSAISALLYRTLFAKGYDRLF